MARTISRVLLTVFFILAGLNHFRNPDFYLALMPLWMPWHVPLIYLSGAAEVAGGIGVLIPRLRRAAAWGLILLLAALMPAHIHMLQHGLILNGKPVAAWLLWARIPLQFALMGWVWWSYMVNGSPGPQVQGPMSPESSGDLGL